VLSSAVVSFIYQGSLFGATIAINDLVEDPSAETRFFSTFVYAERAVPEPSALLLLSVGAAALLRTRRVHRLR
jgi:hypothetical protein